MPAFPDLKPPLLNSACLWASTSADLDALYTSPHTGAITTRTASHPTKGFEESDAIHQYTFTSSSRGVLGKPPSQDPERNTTHPAAGPRQDLSDVSTLNTYGYAPQGLCQYVYMAKELETKYPDIHKPVIFSVTGDAETVANCWKVLTEHHVPERIWCMEINLSCPNISGKPPPAYSKQQLIQFLTELRDHIRRLIFEHTEDLDRHIDAPDNEWSSRILSFKIPIGLKLPPYTYAGQFDNVVEVIRKFNSEGFGIMSTGIVSDGGEAVGGPASGNMTAGSIDPTLLSSFDVDNYISELTSDMELKLSLDRALDQSAKQVPVAEPPAFSESFNDLLGTPLGKYIQDAVFGEPWPIAFVTATNTLGSSLVMDEEDEDGWRPALGSADSSGIGGLAGAALHPIALGNVANLKRRLRDRTGAGATGNVKIIGVGGVSDADGFHRMRAAGADFVGLATALGARGVAIFEDISEGVMV